MAKAIMIQGTMSNAGKSLIAAGLCRVFKQDGYRVAPFKSQNMALNSYITKENLEMGRAQVVQAEAAGVEPEVAMNPILLKPTTDMGSQVIVCGEVVGNMRAVDYFKKKRDYIPVIRAAYDKLAGEYDIIVIEGAGSPAEINLKQDDIVNMGMAKMADAPVLLVGDIDRGGVFAQLVGTVMLLEPEEQDRIAGLIINKFRGDVEILKPGLSMLTERCGKEVLGVVPYADVDIEEEDSLAERLLRKNRGQGIDVAVIRLPKVSNFTDFQALSLEPVVSVRYVEKTSELGKPDVIILPGTKNTIQDMIWLRESGLEAAILRLVGNMVTLLIGICGGYQMLGNTITDSCEAESASACEGRGKRTIRGMGLLPMDTGFEQKKTRTRVEGHTLRFTGDLEALSGKKISGYEIHMGRTESRCNPLLEVCENETTKYDGCYEKNVLGTYIHGIFDEEEFRQAFVKMLCDRKGIQYVQSDLSDFRAYKETQYDKLADLLRESLNMDRIYEIMGIER